MQKTMTALTVLLSGSLLSAEPLRGGMVGMPSDAAPLQSVAEAYVAAVLAGDAKAVAALFAEDGVEMPPGSAPLHGRAAIEGYYRGLFQSCGFATFALSHAETRILGDYGFIVGTSRQALSGVADPRAREETGKYLVILRRSGAAWKVVYAIENADRLAAPGGSGGEALGSGNVRK